MNARCEHWRLGSNTACTRPAVGVFTCTDEEESWTGALCADHLAAYRADPEITVTP